MTKNRKWADEIIEMLSKEENSLLPEIDFSYEWEGMDEESYPSSPPKETYDFETYIRSWDGEEVEAVTGIPAKNYKSINLPDKFSDTL